MHRAVIEVGPGTVRRLCCGTAEAPGAAAALEWVDEPVALVDGEPVAVPELLRGVLAGVCCGRMTESMLVIHPTWWSPRRVARIVAAARPLAAAVSTRPRRRVLAGAAPRGDAGAIIEIGPDLVAVTTGRATVAEPRLGTPAEVAGRVAALVGGGAVVLDAPAAVSGAQPLAGLIGARLRAAGCDVTVVDDALAARLGAPEPASAPASAPEQEPAPKPRPEPAGGGAWVLHRRRLPVVATAVALGVGALVLGGHREPPPAETSTTVLIEGRVAVTVPAGWPVRRVTDGPGSARIEVTSPRDPQNVVHMTQSPSGGTPAVAAELLGRALAAADQPGVFVDFDPAANRAGRPALTYREIRATHRVDWTVLVDGPVRIAIGCQSAATDAGVVANADASIRPVCDQMVHSAHVVN